MTMPTAQEKHRAQRAGNLFARTGKPVTKNPYDINGDLPNRVLARWFIRGFAFGSDDTNVDFDDEE